MGASSDRPLSTKRWAVWLTATVVSFAAMEAHAVSTRRQPTLSGALRAWMGHEPVKPHRWLASMLWLAFWGWLTGHLLLAWPPNLKQRGGTS
jgi:hypothetical protein